MRLFPQGTVVLLLQPELLERNNAIKSRREGVAMKKQYKVHLDEDLKRDADSVLSSMGLSFSTAVGLFLLAVVEEGAIPFQVSAPKARALSRNESKRRPDRFRRLAYMYIC